MWVFKNGLIWELTGASVACIPLKWEDMAGWGGGGMHP